MTKNKLIGLIIMVFGMLFAFGETNYFGNNLFPGSTAESVCDIVSLVICVVGGLIYLKK